MQLSKHYQSHCSRTLVDWLKKVRNSLVSWIRVSSRLILMVSSCCTIVLRTKSKYYDYADALTVRLP